MTIRAEPPGLHLHKTRRYWFVFYAGRQHYLGAEADLEVARQRYAEHLQRWAAALAGQQAERTRRRGIGRKRFTEVALAFIGAKADEGVSDHTVRFYRHALRRFLGVHGLRFTDTFGGCDLLEFRDGLMKLGLGRKAINHEIAAVKTMCQWAIDRELIRPMNLKAARLLPLDPPEPKAWSPEYVKQLVTSILPESVRPWAAVQYLTGMRPSEVVRVVNGQGKWVEPNVYRVKSKTDRTTGKPRFVLFSKRALKWLALCRPHWARLDAYGKAFSQERYWDSERKKQRTRVVVSGGPHPLRHSAASHLQELLGEGSRAMIDVWLGHYPVSVSSVYQPVVFRPLVPLGDRLARLAKLQVPRQS